MNDQQRTIYYNVALFGKPPVRIRYFVEIPGMIFCCREDFLAVIGIITSDSDSVDSKAVGISKTSFVQHFTNESAIREKLDKEGLTNEGQEVLQALRRHFLVKYPYLEDKLKQTQENQTSLNSDTHPRISISHKYPHKSHQLLTPEERDLYGIAPFNGILALGDRLHSIRIKTSPGFPYMYCVPDVMEALVGVPLSHQLKPIFHHLHHKHIQKLSVGEICHVPMEMDFVDETGLLRALGTALDGAVPLRIEIPPEPQVTQKQVETNTEVKNQGDEMPPNDIDGSDNEKNSSSHLQEEAQETSNKTGQDVHSNYGAIPKVPEEDAFEFDGSTIRCFKDEEQNIWICAADICHYLGHQNVREKIAQYGALDGARQFIFGDHPLLFINEKGLEKILDKSHTDQAAKLLIWLDSLQAEDDFEHPQVFHQTSLREALQHALEAEGLEVAHEKATSASALPENSNMNPNQPTNNPQEQNAAFESRDTFETQAEEQKPVTDFNEGLDAHEIHDRLKISQPFNEWMQNQIDTYGFQEGKDYIRADQKGVFVLSEDAAKKIIDAYTAEVVAKANAITSEPIMHDEDANTIVRQGKVIHYFYDQSNKEWYCVNDIKQYLGDEEVQQAIEQYGSSDDPVTVTTRQGEYPCVSKDLLEKILTASRNPEAQVIYRILFSEPEPLEELSESLTPDEKEQKEPASENFTLTQEERPSQQERLDLSSLTAETPSTTTKPTETEERQSEPLSANEAITPKIGSFNGKYFWTIDAKDLHTFFQPPKPYPLWIKDLIDFYGYIENTDYVTDQEKGEFLLSLPMAREIAMTDSTNRGREARAYFAEYSEQPIPSMDTAAENQETPFEPAAEEAPVQEEANPEPEISEEAETASDEVQVQEPETEAEEDSETLEIEEIRDIQPPQENQLSQETPDSIQAWTLEDASFNLGVSVQFLCGYLEDIGWLFPDSLEPKIFSVRKGYMVYDMGSVSADETTGLITEFGLEVVRDKLVNLGILPF